MLFVLKTFLHISFLFLLSSCHVKKDSCFQKTTLGQFLDCRHDEKFLNQKNPVMFSVIQ